MPVTYERRRLVKCPDGYLSWGQYYYAQVVLGYDPKDMVRQGRTKSDIVYEARRHAEKYGLEVVPALQRVNKEGTTT